MGESGETYIVNRDKLMVSESRFLKDAVLKTRVDTFGVNEGLTGKSGVSIYPIQEHSCGWGMVSNQVYKLGITCRNR